MTIHGFPIAYLFRLGFGTYTSAFLSQGSSLESSASVEIHGPDISKNPGNPPADTLFRRLVCNYREFRRKHATEVEMMCKFCSDGVKHSTDCSPCGKWTKSHHSRCIQTGSAVSWTCAFDKAAADTRMASGPAAETSSSQDERNTGQEYHTHRSCTLH